LAKTGLEIEEKPDLGLAITGLEIGKNRFWDQRKIRFGVAKNRF